MTRMRFLRLVSGHSILDLSLTSGINTSRISILERYSDQAKPDELCRIARALQWPVYDAMRLTEQIDYAEIKQYCREQPGQR